MVKKHLLVGLAVLSLSASLFAARSFYDDETVFQPDQIESHDEKTSGGETWHKIAETITAFGRLSVIAANHMEDANVRGASIARITSDVMRLANEALCLGNNVNFGAASNAHKNGVFGVYGAGWFVHDFIQLVKHIRNASQSTKSVNGSAVEEAQKLGLVAKILAKDVLPVIETAAAVYVALTKDYNLPNVSPRAIQWRYVALSAGSLARLLEEYLADRTSPQAKFYLGVAVVNALHLLAEVGYLIKSEGRTREQLAADIAHVEERFKGRVRAMLGILNLDDIATDVPLEEILRQFVEKAPQSSHVLGNLRQNPDLAFNLIGNIVSAKSDMDELGVLLTKQRDYYVSDPQQLANINGKLFVINQINQDLR